MLADSISRWKDYFSQLLNVHKDTDEREIKIQTIELIPEPTLFFKFVALQPRRAKTDRKCCCQMAVQGALWLAKCLSLNLNFSFLNRISLLLISSSYPIVLTKLGGPRSRPYRPTSRKMSRVQPRIERGTSWMAVRRANHYTKQQVIPTLLEIKKWLIDVRRTACLVQWLARLTVIQEVPGSIPGYTLEIFLEVGL